MKKLLLVATLCVAGLVSAKDNVKHLKDDPKMSRSENVIIKNHFFENEKKNEEKKAKTQYGCVYVGYDCGTNAVFCGNNLLEIIDKAWNAYDFMCSQTA